MRNRLLLLIISLMGLIWFNSCTKEKTYDSFEELCTYFETLPEGTYLKDIVKTLKLPEPKETLGASSFYSDRRSLYLLANDQMITIGLKQVMKIGKHTSKAFRFNGDFEVSSTEMVCARWRYANGDSFDFYGPIPEE